MTLPHMSVSSMSVSETPKSPHLRKAKSPHACLRTNVAYTQVYSRRAVPGLTHYYDLHAYFRYNVYLRKPSAAEQERRRRRHWHAARFNASRGGGGGGGGGDRLSGVPDKELSAEIHARWAGVCAAVSDAWVCV